MDKYFSYSNILSTFALCISLGAFIITYLEYSGKYAKADLSWKINSYDIEVDLENNKYNVNSNIELAITNNSSSQLYIIACNFETKNALIGRGGAETKWHQCPTFSDLEEGSSNLVISPSQTRFFKDHYKLSGNLDSMLTDLKKFGIKIDKSINTLFRNRSCTTSFTLNVESRSYGGTCGIIDNSMLYSVMFQTGSGEILRQEIRYTFNFDWPWGKSRH